MFHNRRKFVNFRLILHHITIMTGKQMTIETKNLRLISCDAEILKSAIQGNEVLAKKINVTVQDNWTEFGVGALKYSLDRLTESEEEKNWWTYFPIHKHDNKLIG